MSCAGVGSPPAPVVIVAPVLTPVSPDAPGAPGTAPMLPTSSAREVPAVGMAPVGRCPTLMDPTSPARLVAAPPCPTLILPAFAGPLGPPTGGIGGAPAAACAARVPGVAAPIL